MNTADGFVMAGGRSLRMGRDKALLPWGGTTLLGHALDRLRAVCARVMVLSGPEPRYLDQGAPVLADSVPGAGPLGGLLTALEHAHGAAALLLAVDLPFVPAALLAHLVEAVADADAAVPVVGGRPHPLCAAYGPACLDAVRRRVAGGDLKMTSFWGDVRVRRLGEAELGAFGDPDGVLRNLNTWQEYEASRP